MTNKKIINISKDFHIAPAGRFMKDGRYSGEAFRNKYVIPALENNDIVEIVLDGLDGVGSSFWEEAFGGILRNSNITYDILQNKLTFTCEDDITLIPLIKDLLQQEANRNKK